jgi:hypothetical protein
MRAYVADLGLLARRDVRLGVSWSERPSTSGPTGRWRWTSSSVNNLTLDIALLFSIPFLTWTRWRRWFDHQRARRLFDHDRRQNSVLPFHFLDALLPVFADIFRQTDEASNIFLFRC